MNELKGHSKKFWSATSFQLVIVCTDTVKQIVQLLTLGSKEQMSLAAT